MVSARFPPQQCGVGDYTYFLSEALGRTGHEVDVLTAVGDLDDSMYPVRSKVRLRRVITGWETARLGRIIKRIGEVDADAIVIQYTPHSFDRRGITFAINVLPTLLRVGRRKRVVTNLHELFIPFGNNFKHNAAALWQRAGARLLASGSHALSVTTREWERHLRLMGVRKRIELIPVGSNIPRVEVSEEERAQLRQQILGTSDGVLVAGFGARHDRDVQAVMGAFSDLKRRVRARLVWIGGEQSQLPPKVVHSDRANFVEQGDVEWTGFKPHPVVSRLLRACDIMLLPFIDGVSTRRTSAVTAFQHGLPLLTTRGSHLEPWFIHGENVYLTPCGDPRALAAGLLELAGAPELRSRLAGGGRALYQKHFAWDVIANQVESLARGEGEA